MCYNEKLHKLKKTSDYNWKFCGNENECGLRTESGDHFGLESRTQFWVLINLLLFMVLWQNYLQKILF